MAGASVRREAAGGLCAYTRHDRFFPPVTGRGGRLKMAAASVGVGGWERYLLSPLLSCEAAPQPSWARGPGALPEAQNGGAAAPCSRALQPRHSGLQG